MPRACCRCHRQEVFLVHEGKRMSNLRDGLCHHCILLPERPLEEQLRDSIDFNERIGSLKGGSND